MARYFGGARFWDIENLYRQRKIGMRGWLDGMSSLLPADMDLLLDFAFERAALRPGFIEFVRQAREMGHPVYIASDGFGFYIRPILDKYGCLDLTDTVYKNETLPREGGTLQVKTPHRHLTCPVCGNCKANHVLRLKNDGWKVIFSGDGSNDRFGASWSDRIFARDRLAQFCAEHGLPFTCWADFFDLLRADQGEFASVVKPSPFCRPEAEGYLK
jgi:HAD superfamily phosphoserine phosphatase-like hydrolase